MNVFSIGDLVFTLFFILLIVMFFVSLIFFVRRIAAAQRISAHNKKTVEQKLDRIIELLEQNHKSN